MRGLTSLLLAVLCFTPAWSHAASNADDEAPAAPVVRHSGIRLGFERIALPAGEAMGMASGSYLIEVAPHFYVGPAVHGAVTGHRGGFFTEGIEVARRQRLLSFLDLEAGLYAGGGGGSAAQVGGGLMLRPHADLLWDFGGYRACISVSQVRFVSGSISSRQAGLVFSADRDFDYFPAKFIGQEVDALSAGAKFLVGGGAVVQPTAYVDMKAAPSVGVRLSAGRIKSFSGALNSAIVDLSASFLFGTPAR